MIHSVTLQRVIKAVPDKVYRAFLNKQALCKWLPPNGFMGEVMSADFQVGGTMTMSFTDLSSMNSHSFTWTFKELIPNQKIVHLDQFIDSPFKEEMVTTITLTEVFCGTEIHVTQENIPQEIPLAACYLGWQESLQLLTLLVEAVTE